MQARLEQEMRQRQELSAQLEAEQAERQAQTQRLADITEFLQGLGQHTGFAVPAGLLAPPPRPAAAATPVSMKVFCFRLCFACMTSTFLD